MKTEKIEIVVTSNELNRIVRALYGDCMRHRAIAKEQLEGIDKNFHTQHALELEELAERLEND